MKKQWVRTAPSPVAGADTTAKRLQWAGAIVAKAAATCRRWEEGGDVTDVSETAALAVQAAELALEAVTADEPWDIQLDEPETRRARLAYAGWLLLLAGTDEHGQSQDLYNAAQLLDAAATA